MSKRQAQEILPLNKEQRACKSGQPCSGWMEEDTKEPKQDAGSLMLVQWKMQMNCNRWPLLVSAMHTSCQGCQAQPVDTVPVLKWAVLHINRIRHLN